MEPFVTHYIIFYISGSAAAVLWCCGAVPAVAQPNTVAQPSGVFVQPKGDCASRSAHLIRSC